MKVKTKVISALLSISLIFGSVNPATFAAEQQSHDDAAKILSETTETTEISQESENFIESESKTISNMESDADTISDIESTSEMSSHTESKADTISDIESTSETESDTDTISDVESEADTTSDTKLDADTISDVESASDSENNIELDTETELESKSNTEPYTNIEKNRFEYETKNGVTTVIDTSQDLFDMVHYNANENAIKLSPPTNLYLDDNFNMHFTGVEECKGHYYYEMYKDDEQVDQGSWSVGDTTNVDLSYSRYINESGTYKFRVYADNDYDPDNLIRSEWTDFSEAKTYVRPDQALGTTTAQWDPTEVGKYSYESVEGAGGYAIEVYIDRKNGDGILHKESTWSVNADEHEEAGMQHSRKLDITEDGVYYVSIIALSSDITAIANGEEGPKSQGLDTQNVSTDVNSVIDSALESAGNADEAIDAINKNADISAIQVAMQTDDEVLNKIRELEKKYENEKGVFVGKNQVSEEASQYVNADNISLIGAAFNASDNKSINLNVTVPETKIDVDTNRYADSVQLDLKLVSDSSEIHELRLPITITMPIPAGLDAVHLTILHYKNNGSTPEVVQYRINDDRTITFTVTSFSDFVFAEEKEAGEYEIDIDRVQNGSVQCEVDGTETTIAQSGKMVKLIVEPDTGFVVDTITVTTKDNEEQVTFDTENFTFIMPDKDVFVKVTFKPLAVDSIRIKTNPTKINYFAGETFDPSGLEIEIVYSDNSTKLVKYTEETKAEFSFGIYKDKVLTTEDTSVEITFREKTATIPITVFSEENRKELKLSISNINITYGETYNVSCTAQNIVGESVTLEKDKIKYKYFTSSDSEMTSSPVEAGEYKVQAAFDGNDAYNASISEKAKITINKKTITVSVIPSKTTVEPGEEITYEIKAEGFIGNDTFTKQPVVSIIEGSADVEGTYKLQASGAEVSNNYTINYALPITITVKSNEKTDDDSYNNAERIDLASPGAAVSNIKAKVYDGNAYEPAVKVTIKVNGKTTTLIEGKDYSVLYENNVNAGQNAKVTIKGNGIYKGTLTKNFTITPKSIQKLKIITGGIAGNTTGSDLSDLPVYVLDGADLLAYGKDFNLSSYSATTSAANVTVTGKGNYTGTKTAKITVYNVDSNHLISPQYIGAIQAAAYNGGKAVTIEPVVTISGTRLVKNKDYKIQYQNNKNAGTALAIVTGKGTYKGKAVVPFTIKPTEISNSAVTVKSISAKTYNGKLQKPAVIVTVNIGGKTKKLTKNKDYILAYKNNLHVGTAVVTITGKGNFAGIKTEAKFTINPQQIKKASVKGVQGKLTLTYDKHTLKEGIDYEKPVYGSINKNQVKVTIKGKGDFTGTVTKNIKTM